MTDVIALCIILNKYSNLEDVFVQDLSNAEVHVFGKKIDLDRLPQHSKVTLHTIDKITTDIENVCLNNIQTKWVIFRYNGELWGRDYVRDLVSFVKSKDNQLNILYVEGFYRMNSRLAHVQEVNPKTKPLLSLPRIFQGPVYFTAGIKIIYPLRLIQENHIRFDTEIHNQILRFALFNVDILSSLYIFSGYTYFEVYRRTLNVSVPFNASKPRQSQKYFIKLQDKHQVWYKNKWSLVAWQSLLLQLKK